MAVQIVSENPVDVLNTTAAFTLVKISPQNEELRHGKVIPLFKTPPKIRYQEWKECIDPIYGSSLQALLQAPKASFMDAAITYLEARLYNRPNPYFQP